MENPLRSHYQEELMEAGCDEAGRGCYAGPVYAAAVILPMGFEQGLWNKGAPGRYRAIRAL